MLMRVLGGLLVLLVGMSAAQAASFDCAKAATPFETAICADPELSAADDLLAVAYQTAIGGLSKAALAEVQKTQRAWLDYAQKSCTDDAQLPKGPYNEDQVACLKGAYSARMRRLEQSRMWDGLRFYGIESYGVIPDTTAEPDAFNKVATREAGAPRIDGTGEEAQAFADFVEANTPPLVEDQDETSDVQRSSNVINVSASLISLEINDWWYGHGAAHGNYTITYAHFLRGEKRALVAEDIFEAEGWQGGVGDLAVAALQRSVDGGIWEDASEAAKAAAADPTRWSFSSEGLEITYQPYEVTAYAFGAPKITLSWTELTPYLKAGAMELVY